MLKKTFYIPILGFDGECIDLDMKFHYDCPPVLCPDENREVKPVPEHTSTSYRRKTRRQKQKAIKAMHSFLCETVNENCD